MKKIMITGATGFVGSHLVETLQKKGFEKISIFTRRKTELIDSFKKNGAEIFQGTFDDEEILNRALSGADTVIHVAAATKGLTREDYVKSNVNFTRAIVEKMNSDQKMIHISSLAAAGPSTMESPVDESMPDNPLTWYGETKLLSEKEVEKHSKKNGFSRTTIRPCIVYGPRERDIFEYFKLINKGFYLIMGTGKKRISLIYVKNLVDAIIKTAESEESNGETYLASDDYSANWLDLGEEIKKALGKKRMLKLKLPELLAYPVAWGSDIIGKISGTPQLLNSQKMIEVRQDAWLADNTKLKNLGWKPRYGFEEGIKETANWYRKEGWI